MRKTIIGCGAGAAAVLALAACGGSAAPAAAPGSTHHTTPPAVVAAPSTVAPSTTSPATTTGCTALLAAWYDGSGPDAAANGNGGGENALTTFRNTWSSVIAPSATTLAIQHDSAHALLGATLAEAEPRGGPPACNSAAATAWDKALTDLGDAATIEQTTTVLSTVPAALQDANNGFAQLSIVEAQGGQAATAVTTQTPSAPATAEPAPGTTTVAGLWCSPSASLTVVTSPSLAAWKTTDGYGVVAQLKTGAAAIDNAATPAATVVALAASICAEVQAAHQQPPPVQTATWNEAMGFFLTASTDLHAVSNGASYDTSLAGARVEVNLGLSDLNEFLSLSGA